MTTKTVFFKSSVLVLATIVFAFTLHGISHAQTFTHIYVDAVNGDNQTADGSAAKPYKSITFALLISERNNLPDPWHVHIQPGAYDADPAKPVSERELFPLKLRTGMIFEGATTAEECVIDGLGGTQVPILRGQDVEDVLIRNLTLQNNGGGGIVLWDSGDTRETQSRIEGCIARNNGETGIRTNIPLVLTGNTVSGHRRGVWTHTSIRVIKNIFSNTRGPGLWMEGDIAGNISENTFQNNNNNSRNKGGGFGVAGNFTGNVTHNKFIGNFAHRSGGGFCVFGLYTDSFRLRGNFTGNVTHNTFTNNRASAIGGGIYINQNFTGNVTHNTFTNNTASERGGGIYINYQFTGNLTHNTFTNNSGGAVATGLNFRGNITHNTFANNSGGAVKFYSYAENIIITHNVFDSNSAAEGGAIYLPDGENAEVINNIFFNNTATIKTLQPTRFTNNLFMVSDELSVGVEGAVVHLSSPECRFHNNIFSGMKTAIYTGGTFDLPITHNLFHDIKQDIVNQAGSGLGNDLGFWELFAANASDNLEGAPLLVDPVTSRDFHLQAASPAINAGTNEFAPSDDFDGVARPVGETVDIGPYEYGGDTTDDEEPPIPQDVNRDGVVNILDLVSVASALEEEGQGLVADVNGDGIVNILDLVSVAGALEGVAAAPSLHPQALAILTAADMQTWISEAQHLNLTDVTSQQGIRYLKHLLAALIPEETALLPNYPNPFNPETWIPYRLAKAADVTLTIYDSSGGIVRTLDIGHRVAAVYESREKAIYWDGNNKLGERVASGIYFYHLSAGDYSATRKMVILK